GEPEAGGKESSDGSGIAQVGLREHASALRPAVEDQVGHGPDEHTTQVPPPVPGATDQQMNAHVVRQDGAVAGQRIEVGPVDLPVAHRLTVEQAEAWRAASVAADLSP